MKVLLTYSEAVPFAKTGGLADVAGAFPAALAQNGLDVSVIIPYYRKAFPAALDPGVHVATFRVPTLERSEEGAIRRTALPGSNVAVYLIEHDAYFARDGLYGERGTDYCDNAARFAFFSRAAIETILVLDMDVDVLHLNDWQTALAALYMKTLYADDHRLADTKTLLSIHNLAYGGVFPHWDMRAVGLPWRHFNSKEIEFYGSVSFLKGGLVSADGLATVSPTYAREIQTPEMGHGLDGVLRDRSDRLAGVLNGIDPNAWDPSTDPALCAHYNADDLAGKEACRRALLEEQGLPDDPDVPVIGVISRLAEQKGFDILAEAIDRILDLPARVILLGTGDGRYQEFFSVLAARRPRQIAVNLGFDDGLARRIEAGSDFFLMPSRYEPCGLSQMYSLRYGTVPIVRATGGLADTVFDADGESGAGRANGFTFTPYSADALLACVRRAVTRFADKASMRSLQRSGMSRDNSWSTRAGEYISIYEGLCGDASC